MLTLRDIERHIDAIRTAIEVNRTWPDRSRVIPELERKLRRKIREKEQFISSIQPE